jgi:hypothetical protein
MWLTKTGYEKTLSYPDLEAINLGTTNDPS